MSGDGGPRKTRAAPPLEVLATRRFARSYREATEAVRTSCDRAIAELARRAPSPGRRVKPVLPDKYFFEARLDRGDRLIFRDRSHSDGPGRLVLADLVSHDDIGRYGRR